jgi:hypothetical protein
MIRAVVRKQCIKGIGMAEAKVQQIAQEIRMLIEVARQELIAEILPLLLLTLGSVQAVTRVLDALSTEELDALVEHARMRNIAIPETTLPTVLRDALYTTTGGARCGVDLVSAGCHRIATARPYESLKHDQCICACTD